MRHLTWAKTTMRALIVPAPSGTSDVRPYRPLPPSLSLSLCLPSSLTRRTRCAGSRGGCVNVENICPGYERVLLNQCASCHCHCHCLCHCHMCLLCLLSVHCSLSLSLHECVCVCVSVDKGCACRSSRCRLRNMNMHAAEEGAGAVAQPVPGREGGRERGGVTVRTINKFARCRVAKQLLML